MDSFKPKEAAQLLCLAAFFFFLPGYSLTIAIPALWSLLLSCLLLPVSPLHTFERKKGSKWVAGQTVLACLGEPSSFPVCFWARKAALDIWSSWQPQPAKLLFWFQWIKIKNPLPPWQRALIGVLHYRERKKGAQRKIKRRSVVSRILKKPVMQKKKRQVLDSLVDKESPLWKQAESAWKIQKKTLSVVPRTLF